MLKQLINSILVVAVLLTVVPSISMARDSAGGPGAGSSSGGDSGSSDGGGEGDFFAGTFDEPDDRDPGRGRDKDRGRDRDPSFPTFPPLLDLREVSDLCERTIDQNGEGRCIDDRL